MKHSIKRPSPALVIGSLALCVAVGGGTAVAASSALPAHSVHTKQLARHAVTTSKIANHAVGLGKLSSSAKHALRGPRGPQGARGPAGPGSTIQVSSLGGVWVAHNDGVEGTSTIDSHGIELGGSADNGGLSDSNDFAGVATHLLDGLTPADLSTITYTESYTMPTDSHFAAPYFKLKLQQGSDTSTCGNDDVVYNPSVQTHNLDYAGEVETFDVTAPYSTVGVNNDANPVDGPYPVAIHSASNGAGKDVSGEQICLAEIILGGGSAADNAKATIYNVTFAGVANAGLSPRSFTFGS